MRSVRPLPVDARPVGHRSFIPGQEQMGISALVKHLAMSFKAEEIIERRRRNYYALLGRLREISPPLVQELEPGVSPLFYPFWCEDKRAVQAALALEGIESIDFWSAGSPLVPEGMFPTVDSLRRHVLELPIHQDLTPLDLDRIAGAVRRIAHARRSAA